jgi:hypothetical protein
LLLPHWGALARAAAGIACMAVAAWHDGVSPRSLWLIPLVLALGWSILAVSAVLARAGVSRPDLDVIQLVVRWGTREHEVAPLSIGASLFQFLLGIVTIPAVKLLSPSVMYQPEIAPSTEAVLLALGISIALAAVVYLLWSGRVALHAPEDQQREADETS